MRIARSKYNHGGAEISQTSDLDCKNKSNEDQKNEKDERRRGKAKC